MAKFVLEFDEAPALVFVQEQGKAVIYQDGKKLNGVRSCTIRAAAGDVTTHEVEYLTGYTKEEEQ